MRPFANIQNGSSPVAVYGAIFVCVNIAYLVFERQALGQAARALMPERARRLGTWGSFAPLSVFPIATLVSLSAPRIGFAQISCGLLPYLTPEAPDISAVS